MANIVNNTSTRVKTYFKEFFPGMVPLFVLAHFMHHIPGFITQPLLPSIRDSYHLSYYRASWLVSAYSLAYGASNLPAGWLGGRVPPRILIAVGVAGVATAGLLVGVAPTYLMVVVAMLLMGALGGGYHPSASPLVAESVSFEKRGHALGVHQIGGTAANIVTPLVAAAIAVALTWRGSFIVLTAPIIAFGIYLYVLLKRRGLGNVPPAIPSQSISTNVNTAGNVRRMVSLVTLGAAVQVFVYSTLSFVTLLVVDQYKGSQELGAAMFALSQFAGLIAGPLGGHISDKAGKVRVILTVGLAAGPLIYLLSLCTNWWLLSVVLLATGTCMYTAMPVAESYVISHAAPRHRSIILGIYYFASRGGPGILMPILGKLIDQFSFGHAFAVEGTALFVIALVCSLLLWGTKD